MRHINWEAQADTVIATIARREDERKKREYLMVIAASVMAIGITVAVAAGYYFQSGNAIADQATVESYDLYAYNGMWDQQ